MSDLIDRLSKLRREGGRSGDAEIWSVCTDAIAKLESQSTEREVITGWREFDHPEWFCRRTAEYMADLMREASASGTQEPTILPEGGYTPGLKDDS